MIKDCKMRHKNGNCLPAGGFCTANKNLCEALQNAYRMGQENLERKTGKWIHGAYTSGTEYRRCTNCLTEIEEVFFGFEYAVNYCPNCGSYNGGEQDEQQTEKTSTNQENMQKMRNQTCKQTRGRRSLHEVWME